MSRRGLTTVLVILLASGSLATWGSVAPAATGESGLRLRVERIARPQGCTDQGGGPNDCGFDLATIPIPAGGDVDIVVTLTFSYRQSAGSRGSIHAVYEGGDRTDTVMTPGRYALGSGPRTSTSLSWFARDVPGGASYRFGAVTTGCCPTLGTRHMIAVIEITPAGAR